ncbi:MULTISPECIES: hypothetical protein [Serratia]|uniref:hypothetical protein n=1 Tax=Serratia TaxID=613 RepID=UPI0008A891C6|nr:hypothetical protein [Serratia marcescens]APS35504.1 hypothetical protein RN42_17355 [Serratia marcescens]OHT35556.1 hypothetical protein BGV45_08420 [Serratia marcescens]OHT37276.1 hypothetical protein BGV46_08410 [Serratia marcescens]
MKAVNIKCWKIELFEEPKPSASIVNSLRMSENRLPFFTGYSKKPINLEELRDEQFITIRSNLESLESSTFRVSRIHEVKCSPIYEIDNSFDEAAKPLIKWLAENVHPHHTAIVTSNRAELLMGESVINTDEYLKD